MLSDVMGSVAAVLNESGRLHERVVYDPHGRARHHFAGDADDKAAISALTFPVDITDPAYDSNLDGVINTADLSELFAMPVRPALPMRGQRMNTPQATATDGMDATHDPRQRPPARKTRPQLSLQAGLLK